MADRWYDSLAGDDEGRTCQGIEERACRETPGNFFRILAANMSTGIGDRLASAKTTLPWLLSYLGSPSAVISMLVPLRESGSLLPQLLLGALVRRQAVRKWVWVGGSVVQGMSLVGMAMVAGLLEGGTAGIAILILLALFSVARGACSLAYKDVLGKTIPKTRRGRLSGWIVSAAGLGALILGTILGFMPEPDSVWFYAGLLVGAAICWFLAAWVFARVVEFPGETEGGHQAIAEAMGKLKLLRDDRSFRLFTAGRALAMGSGLAAPFYVVLGQEKLGSAVSLLGIFLAMEGLAGLIAAPVWGRAADYSSRLVFGLASALAGVASLAVVGWVWLEPSAEASRWFFALAFLALGLAHAGVRMGRKIYLVDLAEGNRRTDYVAVSNTVIGLLLLGIGLGGAIVATVSVPVTLAILGLMGLAGAWVSLAWRDVSG